MAYVLFDVPVGTSEGIARFYHEILETGATVKRLEGAPAAHVSVGQHQQLIFRECKGRLPKYDGHHVQLYVNNFSGPHAKLRERGGSPPDASEPTRVITVRLPKSLHESLRTEAHEKRTSMNKLCISKLLQMVDEQLIPSD